LVNDRIARLLFPLDVPGVWEVSVGRVIRKREGEGEGGRDRERERERER
jgi:hypothetical protein